MGKAGGTGHRIVWFSAQARSASVTFHTGGWGDAVQRGGRSESRRMGAWLALAALLSLALLAGVFALARRNALADMAQSRQGELQTRVQALESVLSRQRAVATVLADDALVRTALEQPIGPYRDRVSAKLDRLRDETDSAVIYLLDRAGIAIAASNWDEAQSFVGQDYSFRDYFSQALRQGQATQFALGTVSNRPGLYLSHDVVSGDRDLGVVVVKVEFDALEANWAAGPGLTLVLDAQGQIILSGRPALRFSRPVPDPGTVSSSAPVPGTDWTMTIAEPVAPANFAAALAAGTAGFGLMLLYAGAGLALRARLRVRARAEAERRYRADLERAVQDRTRALMDEARERRAAEMRLDRLQAEMVQANKLAALGQITAGVAHEVNQPLAAIRLMAENGAALLPRDAAPEVAGNLSSILRMTDRIARITDQLRGFARKATGQVGPVSLKEAVDAALLLTASRRTAQRIALDLPAIDPGLRVMAETVRLEQILVNLLQNAQEALADTPDPCIALSVEPEPSSVRITLSDNGPGIAPEARAQLFTPFATSKPKGLGLGLVISQEIARDFGGSLRAGPATGQGASFVLELPRAA